jgi:hypothetical protein
MNALEGAVTDISNALDHTRPARVLAMLHAENLPVYLTGVLGAPPETVAGRQAWCGLAWEIESYRDSHPAAVRHESDVGPQAALGRCPEHYSETHTWVHLAGRIAGGNDIVAAAGSMTADDLTAELGDVRCWAARLHAAEKVLGADRVLTTLERGIDLGL